MSGSSILRFSSVAANADARLMQNISLTLVCWLHAETKKMSVESILTRI